VKGANLDLTIQLYFFLTIKVKTSSWFLNGFGVEARASR
jgi:hypothetical protein